MCVASAAHFFCFEGISLNLLDYKKLGENIRLYRKKRGMTQEQLAEKVNLSTVYIGYVENGKKQIGLQALVNVANALEASVDELIGTKSSAFYGEPKFDLKRSEKQKYELADKITKAVIEILENTNR